MLNSSFLNKNRPYALHPCVWGSGEEVLADCHASDPQPPADTDPKVSIWFHFERSSLMSLQSVCSSTKSPPGFMPGSQTAKCVCVCQ